MVTLKEFKIRLKGHYYQSLGGANKGIGKSQSQSMSRIEKESARRSAVRHFGRGR